MTNFRHPKTWEDGVMPLSDFPAWKQQQIAEEVAAPRPPGKLLRFELCEMQSRAWYEWHWTRGIDPDARRPTISRALRKAVYDRDGYACLHCGSTDALSLDHIYPFSLGGTDTLANLQTLCMPCNVRKGARVDVVQGR